MSATDTLGSNPTQRLTDDLESLVGEAEQLATANGSDKTYQAAWERIKARLQVAKEDLRELEDVTLLKAKRAARATDESVHEHPYVAMGLAAGIGLLVGLLISRR